MVHLALEGDAGDGGRSHGQISYAASQDGAR